MPEKSIVRAGHRLLARLGARLGDIIAGASGLAAYEQYVSHQRAHHPDVKPMSRQAFFRSDLTARWEGVRRCC